MHKYIYYSCEITIRKKIYNKQSMYWSKQLCNEEILFPESQWTDDKHNRLEFITQ